MTYQGVKFKTEMIGNTVPSDQRLEELIFWCEVFHKNDLAPPYEGGSYGNLSFRTDDGFVITASQSGLDESNSPDRFVKVTQVDLINGIVYAIGTRKPSSEAMVHHAIYDKRPDIQAVFHGHCSKISQKAVELGIPITAREEEYGTPALVERVLEILDYQANFLEMRNHGFISLGKTINLAGSLALIYLEIADSFKTKTLSQINE